DIIRLVLATPDDNRVSPEQLTEKVQQGLGSPHALLAHVRPAALAAGYDILHELGRGGMGVVYLARQSRLKRLVAFKVIHTGAHADAVHRARFCAEATAVARLQHPNIVQVYEVGEREGVLFLALEYVEGGTLAAKLAGQRQVPADAARLLEVLAQAV